MTTVGGCIHGSSTGLSKNLAVNWLLGSGAWVATLIYHRRTNLIERATAAGHSTLDGRAMLVHQGARAFSIWTGTTAPIEVMARALDASLAR